jgi:Cu+-exporting ATPase
MSIMVGIGKGAGAGVLIRSAETLERLERVDTLVLDKTGTLTEGRPAVTGVIAFAGTNAQRALGVAAALEQGSTHPLAQAILTHAAATGATPAAIDAFMSVLGRGAQARAQDSGNSASSPACLAAEGGARRCGRRRRRARRRTIAAVAEGDHLLAVIALWLRSQYGGMAPRL